MRLNTNALLLFALPAMIGACGSAAKTRARPLLAELPVDSLLKTLGPQVVKHHVGGASGTSSDMTSRFEETYTADFDTPVADLAMISDLAEKVRAIVAQRGGRVRGGSSIGAFTTFDYTADSLYGLVAIAAIKNEQHESLVVSVREIAVPVR